MLKSKKEKVKFRDSRFGTEHIAKVKTKKLEELKPNVIFTPVDSKGNLSDISYTVDYYDAEKEKYVASSFRSKNEIKKNFKRNQKVTQDIIFQSK